MRQLIDASRSATTRLILIYGALFAVWCIVLLGVVQWDASRYLVGITDQMLLQRLHYLELSDPNELVKTVRAAAAVDPRSVTRIGLFDRQGSVIAGNLRAIPADMAEDGQVHPLEMPSLGDSGNSARAVAARLPNGQQLLVLKESNTVQGLGAIIRRGLWWGLSLTLIPGLLGGILLARGPARRIRQLQAATEPIRAGDLTRRLPVGRRGDEIDLLAGVVNRMLDEIERLMGEVKGVCDNIAHDLRTPLTHLRSRLHRTRQQWADRPEGELLETCLADVDGLLARFRALLRVSELEDRKRSSCFESVDLAQILLQVHEFYAPLAEDRGQHFSLRVGNLPLLCGDPHLLFEAFANLVGNAMKFAPEEGHIELSAVSVDGGDVLVTVADNGPGIAASERDAVLRRFYRGDNSRSTEGSGLGLSIVNAIVGLHGYRLEIGGDERGARVSVRCRPASVLHMATDPS